VSRQTFGRTTAVRAADTGAQMTRPTSAALASLALVAALVAAPASGDEAALSPRNASYTIDVRLDPSDHSLEGSGTLRWRNLQETPAEELRFHLYWNAFRNDRSTWMLEQRMRKWPIDVSEVEPEDWGFVELRSLELLGVEPVAEEGAEVVVPAGEPAQRVGLLAGSEFVSPDDGNPEDRTVLRVPLPRPVGPGETAEVAFTFRARVPKTFDRTGRRGEEYFLAHWFPKVGVWEAEGWNCHQFHAPTEFFSDYGVYDVTMTVPAGWVVGSTGREVERRENPDGTDTHRFVQEDVHAFTWTTSPDFRVAEQRFEVEGLPPVDMRLLYQPEHEAQVDRHFAATRAALEHYGRWYGPYPYPQVTVVDPGWETGFAGMEYPTLFTAGTKRFAPFGGGSPEGVTIHEAGHQFWYAIVGNNEFEHAWLDEGLNSFSDARVMDVVYGDELHVERFLKPPAMPGVNGFLPLVLPDVRRRRMVQGNGISRYLEARGWEADAQSTPTFRYHPSTSSTVSYTRTAMWLSTLERFLGWETLQKILATHFERGRFRHPTPEEFFATANEVAGRDLSWFFDQVWARSVEFDYEIERAKSVRVAPTGLVDGPEGLEIGAPGDDGPWRSEVVVRRLGAGVFPIDVLLVFEDGSEVRRSWDGRERWKLFVEERPAELAWAVADPDRVLLMDARYANNSRMRDGGATSRFASTKWGAKWMVWLQDLLLTFGFFG